MKALVCHAPRDLRLDAVLPRGVIVTVGLGGEVSLPLNKMVARELELRGSFRFHDEFAVAQSQTFLSFTWY